MRRISVLLALLGIALAAALVVVVPGAVGVQEAGYVGLGVSLLRRP